VATEAAPCMGPGPGTRTSHGRFDRPYGGGGQGMGELNPSRAGPIRAEQRSLPAGSPRDLYLRPAGSGKPLARRRRG